MIWKYGVVRFVVGQASENPPPVAFIVRISKPAALVRFQGELAFFEKSGRYNGLTNAGRSLLFRSYNDNVHKTINLNK